MSAVSLSEAVQTAMGQYFDDMQGELPTNLYPLFLSQVEKPFLEVVLRQCDGNQSKASAMLGINRNTLRKKIQVYGLKIADVTD